MLPVEEYGTRTQQSLQTVAFLSMNVVNITHWKSKILPHRRLDTVERGRGSSSVNGSPVAIIVRVV